MYCNLLLHRYYLLDVIIENHRSRRSTPVRVIWIMEWKHTTRIGVTASTETDTWSDSPNQIESTRVRGGQLCDSGASLARIGREIRCIALTFASDRTSSIAGQRQFGEGVSDFAYFSAVVQRRLLPIANQAREQCLNARRLNNQSGKPSNQESGSSLPPHCYLPYK